MTETVIVEAEVSADDLRRAGWHHEDDGDDGWHWDSDCPAEELGDAEGELEDVQARLLLFCDALHRLAHTGEPWLSKDCAYQPCRDLHAGADRPWPT